jgi:hypothetical protein
VNAENCSAASQQAFCVLMLRYPIQRFSVKRPFLSGFFPLSGSFWVKIDERGLTTKKIYIFSLMPGFRPKIRPKTV